MHDNQAVSRHYGVGQFGTKHNINFIQNPASISAKFVSYMFSSISLQFKQYLFINPASISAIFFINPTFLSAVFFHFQQYSFNWSRFQFSNTFSSIQLSFQQYAFISPASISAISFSSIAFSFQQYPFQQSRFDFSFLHLCRFHFTICDRLRQKQAFGKKISFADFSLELINNNFWLKCWKNYYSIFIGSKDMNFVMLSYSKLQFREKRMQSWLIQIKILSSACVVYLEFVGTIKAKRPNEVIFRKLNA